MISSRSPRYYILFGVLSAVAVAFAPSPPSSTTTARTTTPLNFRNVKTITSPTYNLINHNRAGSSTTPARGGVKPLQALIPVDPWFFTRMGLGIGIMNVVTRKINRDALENLAWEQRLEEAREDKLLADPTLTELDLLREKGASSGRSYGNAARYEEEREDDFYRRRGGGGSRVSTRGKSRNSPNPRTMTDEEITSFEREFGIEYDPYYDEPYTADELPEDMKYREDGIYRDRRYENGEIFYYDEEEDVFYRQGSRPRKSKPFWKFW